MIEEDADDVSDPKSFEPSDEINMKKENTELKTTQEPKSKATDAHDSNPVLKHKNPMFTYS